jgi:hypothetical protein
MNLHLAHSPSRAAPEPLRVWCHRLLAAGRLIEHIAKDVFDTA